MEVIDAAGVMAWALLDELPTAGQVKGALLIVTAVLLLVLEGKLSLTGERGG